MTEFSFAVLCGCMDQATYDDVTLILRLYELRREEKMRAARAWFAKNCKPKTLAEFNELCPMGSEGNAYWRQVVSYWDMAASFVVAGVLNQDLFFQSGRELLFVWLRVEPVIYDLRKNNGDATFLSHLEKVANAYAHYLGPQVHDSYAARVRG